MLFVISGLNGFAVAATDGRLGTVKDFLFDDRSWRVRWLVVDTGTWLSGRKVLIHPSAIAPLEYGPVSGGGLPMMGFGPDTVLAVRLTRQQIEASPDIGEHEPVSMQMQSHLYDYYGWDPYWGTNYFGMNAMASPMSPPPLFADSMRRADSDTETHPGDGDPHLRSAAEVNGYHIHATDGDIGHVENFLADDASWDIRYLIVATRNWWPGRHVLIAPFAVKDIDWSQRHVQLGVSREQVKSSPPWDPVALIDKISEQRLHSHYGWPGYGW
jgi:hypothetical protein